MLPWAWGRDDRPSVKALQGGLLCAPILQAIILNRFPEAMKGYLACVYLWGRELPTDEVATIARGAYRYYFLLQVT